MLVLDLFSGIGGFSLGFERAGLRTVAFCEASPFARAILRRHWPGVACYDDVCTLSAARLRADGVPLPHIVCGGFPCQDISTAGGGAGLDGLRSGLWRHMLRLVGECRPAWVVIENVPALRVRGADRILGELAASGYACWPVVVGAAHAGAPHRRQRSFLLAHAARAGLEGRVDRSAVPPARLCVERFGGWLPEPGLGRVVDGLPARVDRRTRLTALGNAVVPEVAQAVAEAILAVSGQATNAGPAELPPYAAAERTRSANVLRNLTTLGATTARQ